MCRALMPKKCWTKLPKKCWTKMPDLPIHLACLDSLYYTHDALTVQTLTVAPRLKPLMLMSHIKTAAPAPAMG
jgi:hypothetical protein